MVKQWAMGDWVALETVCSDLLHFLKTSTPKRCIQVVHYEPKVFGSSLGLHWFSMGLAMPRRQLGISSACKLMKTFGLLEKLFLDTCMMGTSGFYELYVLTIFNFMNYSLYSTCI